MEDNQLDRSEFNDGSIIYSVTVGFQLTLSGDETKNETKRNEMKRRTIQAKYALAL